MARFQHRRRSIVVLGLAAAGVAAAAGPAAAAEMLYGVTSDNRLIAFQSDNPSNLLLNRPIAGLQPGEEIRGIDLRPANRVLYALSSAGRLYTIEPLSGSARLVGPLSVPLMGSAVGFDFNPTVDRIRVVTDQRQNLRVNPDTAMALVDGPLAYAPNDPGASTTPQVVAAAYTNSFPGATSTDLLDIDAARGTLVRQNPPNAGVLTTIGSLGVDGRPTSFDIGTNNLALAVIERGGLSELYQIDIANGRASRAARRNAIGTVRRVIGGVAAAGQVPDDRTRPIVVVDLDRSQSRSVAQRSGLRGSLACNEACFATISVRAGSRVVGKTSAVVRGSAGRTRFRVDSRSLRRAAAGARRLSVRIEVADGAGNRTIVTRPVALH